jgi:hypothetical protein
MSHALTTASAEHHSVSRNRVQPLAESRGRSIALALVLTFALPLAARAEVHVEGSPAAVRITTSRDSIGDVLSALGVAFDLRHRSAIGLDAAANPTYAGPIERVIANLLDGFNYAVKTSQGTTTEIIVFGRRGEVAIPPPAPKRSTGLLSRWR